LQKSDSEACKKIQHPFLTVSDRGKNVERKRMKVVLEIQTMTYISLHVNREAVTMTDHRNVERPGESGSASRARTAAEKARR
jgi:hypothetical protein